MESNTADDAPDVVIDTPYVSAGLRRVTTLVGLAVVMLLLLPDVKGRYEAVAVLAGMYALFVVGMWVANVRVSFHREYLAIERGLGSLRLVTRVEYQRMGRVRPSDRPVNVTIDLLDGQKIYIADTGARAGHAYVGVVFLSNFRRRRPMTGYASGVASTAVLRGANGRIDNL